MRITATKVQVQKTIFSTSLEKSIAVLLLPHVELTAAIEQELQSNPLLEADPEKNESDNSQDNTGPQIEPDRMNAVINLSPNAPGSVSEEDHESDLPSAESIVSLEDYLLQQLYWETTDPLRIKTGEFIIGNLDKDGFLHLTCEEVSNTLGISDISTIREVLNSIQNFDPVGSATKDFKECLVVQLKTRPSPFRDLAIRIVEHFLNDLGEKRYEVLSKKLSVSVEDLHEAEALISSLEPRPARNYRPPSPTVYVEPDLYLRKNEEGEYAVETNKSGLPTLKISQTYRKLLNQPNLSKEDRNFIKEKITHAVNFIKNINLRGETLTAVAGYILDRQKEFFDDETAALSPMKLKDVAEHLERCESTISRAISNKYIDTPQGLFPLKFFFSNNISQQNQGNISAHRIKQELVELIEEENKQAPLSDLDIQTHFRSKGVHLARRTITKYRQTLHIPASHLRK